MQGLITDRTQHNVSRRSSLSAKGWLGMTTQERAEWLGDPFESKDANLLPPGPYYSDTVELIYRNQEIVAKSLGSGVYLFAPSIIGEAVNYENKTFTLSVGNIVGAGNAMPKIDLYWHDENGYEYAGASLLNAGSITFSTSEFPNTNKRKYLAIYVYVTTENSVGAGTTVRFEKVMLNVGSIKSNYVPYVEVLATNCTKGAYNYSDLNRVERAVSEISDLSGLGLITKTDWTMWDIPKQSEMSRYLSNIKTIRDTYSISVDLPETMNNLTYIYANNIENILTLAYQKIIGG